MQPPTQSCQVVLVCVCRDTLNPVRILWFATLVTATVKSVFRELSMAALLVLIRLPQLIQSPSYVHAALVITTLGQVVRVVVLSVQVVPGVRHTVSHVLTLTVRLSQELARVLTRTPK